MTALVQTTQSPGDAFVGDLLDITPLARRYGFYLEVRIARALADCVRDESVLGCILRAASDTLKMRSARLSPMKPLVFAFDTLRAPAQIAARCRLALRLDRGSRSLPAITLDLAN